jgi:hypothetical protein
VVVAPTGVRYKSFLWRFVDALCIVEMLFLNNVIKNEEKHQQCAIKSFFNVLQLAPPLLFSNNAPKFEFPHNSLEKSTCELI